MSQKPVIAMTEEEFQKFLDQDIQRIVDQAQQSAEQCQTKEALEGFVQAMLNVREKYDQGHLTPVQRNQGSDKVSQEFMEMLGRMRSCRLKGA